ncbi:MAG: TIGR04372 family glycosyltransferase [Hyphomicrobiales bacterium]|nr:TIGR04372 family glycosyltransferase [Hyphomicrobiales bacterium]MCP5373642.1 TIGR04372 family glycosyltransferase [Hyphomicrobiales bacterium]
MSGGPVVAAFLGTQALGDFVMYHLTAASVARSLQGARLVVVYRADRPYKDFVTRLNPWVADTVVLPADPGRVAPLDWLDGGGPLPRPDILLTPSMLEVNRCLGRPPRFRVPAEAAAGLAARLAARGVDPDRWFAVLHVRETGYQFRRDVDAARCADPLTYVPAVEDIIAQGGQVVRIGDPTMAPLPARTGLVDLRHDGTFEDQAHAIARARFFLGTDSGPTQLACALKTPVATTNAVQFGVWNDGDLALAKRYRLADGRVLATRELMDMGALNAHGKRPGGMVQMDNTPEELRAVAARMVAATADCPGWRGDAAADGGAATDDAVTLPLAWRAMTDMGRVEVWE